MPSSQAGGESSAFHHVIMPREHSALGGTATEKDPLAVTKMTYHFEKSLNLGCIDDQQSSPSKKMVVTPSPPAKVHKRSASDPGGNRLPTSYRHEALEDLLATLCERHEKYGDSHPKTASTYNQLGTYHFRHSHWEEAESSYAEALACFQAAFRTGKSRNKEYCRTKGALTIASILSNIGTVCWRTGRLAEATDYIEQTVKIQEGLLAQESDRLIIDKVEVGGTYYNLGIVHSLRGCHRLAIKALGRARQLYQDAEMMYGPLLLESSRVVDAIGKVFMLGGNPDEALKHLYDALHMKKRILDAKHPSVLRTLSTIAEVHAQKNEYPMAKHLLQQILHAQKVALDRTADKEQQDLITLDISATKKLLLGLSKVRQEIRI
mmetsp:Transcript_27161/g.78355  ORF Transcript_27161/g.78355 Transcript_27161/m.78355 type:complete len:378 (+) Transcript_27161:176-1309(+)